MMSPPSSTPVQSLPSDEVHVWLVEPERVVEPRLLEAYRGLLDAGEREKHLRFHFERHRHLYLVSHALVRTTLSRYAPVAPEAWRFVTNAYGRPEVAGDLAPGLRFNLSHTDGMAICAVAREVDVGADVEDGSRPGQTVEVADSFFASSEVLALRALPAGRQQERFFEYWTLKESYIKARGAGLSLPLAQFAFHLEAGRMPRISFDARLEDEPEAWHFLHWRPSERHHAAVALRRARGLPLTVRCWRGVPLLGAEAPVVLREGAAPGLEPATGL